MEKIIPKPTKVSEPFWRGCDDGRLVIQQCQHCRSFTFYPVFVCPHCFSTKLEWTPVGGRGSVYSCTVVERSPSPAFAQEVPYVVALIELDEGPVMMSNVVTANPHGVRIGDRVMVAFKRISSDLALPVFEPTSG